MDTKWKKSNAGAACCTGMLAVCAAMQKTRREAVRGIGKALGKIPFEIMLIVFAGVLYLDYMMFLFLIIWGDSATWVSLLGVVLITVWAVHLIWLYLHYGNRPWKNSLVRRGREWFQKREMRLGIQKRMAARIFRPLYFLAASAGIILTAYLLDCGYLLFGHTVGRGWVSRLYSVAAVMLLIVIALLFYNAFCQWRLAADLGCLSDAIDAAWDGGKHPGCKMPSDSDLAEMAGKVAGIRDGLEKAVEERMKSERMKVELVANVSHDIKTPLTSIISYVDLLKQDDSLSGELKDYVEILAQKSERLKEMVQDVFEVSKASSGQLSIRMERLDLAKLLRQTLADMQDQIESTPVSVRTQIPEGSVEIFADGQRLYRVFQNLLQNALQYSLEGSRIYVRLEKKNGMATAIVRNMSKCELDDETDFTERFVRGDVSRTDGGSGLGLSIAKSFTEACGGTFNVETMADLFVVTVEFALEDAEEKQIT